GPQQADAHQRRRNPSHHADWLVDRRHPEKLGEPSPPRGGGAPRGRPTVRALAASAPLVAARPGATVLAVTTAPGGAVYPVVAVQRYGQGRSMVFAGEASWRWKMLVASSNRSYEFFWRQAARWLTATSPDPVAITVPDAPEPGDAISIDVDARDAAYAPVPDASVELTLTAPGGDATPIKLRRADAAGGRF